MTKYLVTFPSAAMDLGPEDLARASVDSHAVIEELKAAGAYVFGGGIDESVAPVRVSADGSISSELYPGSLTGGFLVLELPTREDALAWASRVAAGCQCDQEVREFMFDTAS